MAAPDPEGFSLAAKVIAAFVAVGTPITWLWAKLDKKADKHTVNGQFQKVENELAVQRGHIGKVFDQMRDSESKNEERHRELLMHLIEKKGN